MNTKLTVRGAVTSVPLWICVGASALLAWLIVGEFNDEPASPPVEVPSALELERQGYFGPSPHWLPRQAASASAPAERLSKGVTP